MAKKRTNAARLSLAIAFTACAPGSRDHGAPSLAPTVAPLEVSIADATTSDASTPRPDAPSPSMPPTSCGPDPTRAPSAEAYPPRRRLVSDAERAAVEARFRADNAQSTWTTITVSPLGFVAYADATPYPHPDQDRHREAAISYFGLQQSYFGISPALRPLIADCADDKGYIGVRFLQYWGPHIAATLTFTNSGRTLLGPWLEDLPPAPPELDDSRVIASLVGRKVTVKRTAWMRHPLPPGGRAIPPHVTTVHRALTEHDFRVVRLVQGFRSTTDRAVAEIRIVAAIDVATGLPIADGSGVQSEDEVTFDPPVPKLPRHVDAVTGESLDARELVYPLPPH